MLMLFLPAGIPHLLSKPVLQESHKQSNFAFATQTGAQSCSLPLKKPQPTTTKAVFHYMHKA